MADYAATRSPVSLDQIVRDNQRLLHHVLKRFATADEPYEDLLQVANLGLIKAVQRFDPGKGVRFSTYAVPVVEGEVRHHLRDSLLLRQPRWVKKIYHEIEDAVRVLTKKLDRPPHLTRSPQALNISEAGILEVLNVYARIDLQGLPESYADGADGHVADAGEVHSLHLTSFSLPIEDRIALYDALDRLTAFRAQADLPALLSRVHPARGGGRPRPHAEEGVARVDQGPGAAQAGHDAPRLLSAHLGRARIARR